MSAYSLEGYLTALTMRAVPTVLVEGPTDLKFISRVVRELEMEGRLEHDAILIDVVHLVGDPDLPSGAREAVEAIYRRAEAEALRMAALVDREYRRFRFEDDAVEDLHPRHHAEGSLFWTRGHSIENYFFACDFICSYLILSAPEEISLDALRRVQRAFPSVLVGAAALSIAAHSCRILTRCGGLARREHWVASGPAVALDPEALGEAARARGVSVDAAEEFATQITRYQELLLSTEDPELAQWASHGHLGREAIWAGVARVLELAGVDGMVVDGVSSGFVDRKVRIAADAWAKAIVRGETESPEGLWAWIEARAA